jgi:hypothetical protein
MTARPQVLGIDIPVRVDCTACTIGLDRRAAVSTRWWSDQKACRLSLWFIRASGHRPPHACCAAMTLFRELRLSKHPWCLYVSSAHSRSLIALYKASFYSEKPTPIRSSPHMPPLHCICWRTEITAFPHCLVRALPIATLLQVGSWIEVDKIYVRMGGALTHTLPAARVPPLLDCRTGPCAGRPS